MDQGRIDRARQTAANTAIARADGENSGSSGQVGVTVSLGNYPTTPNAYFAFNPVTVGGAEVEGGPAAFDVDTTRVIYALGLGNAVPPVGKKLPLSLVDSDRYVFSYWT